MKILITAGTDMIRAKLATYFSQQALRFFIVDHIYKDRYNSPTHLTSFLNFLSFGQNMGV